MPPSIILEVLKITEAEMELRDLTREAEQARPALSEQEHEDKAIALAEEQEDISFRTDTVIGKIEEMPNASEFGKELQILDGARAAMEEAFEELDAMETGAGAVAAETEAIELLLRARRQGSGGGSGGGGAGSGAVAGKSKGGTDGVDALALAGRSSGVNDVIDYRDVDRTTSPTVSRVPVELQSALDRYFEAIEAKE